MVLMLWNIGDEFMNFVFSRFTFSCMKLRKQRIHFVSYRASSYNTWVSPWLRKHHRNSRSGNALFPGTSAGADDDGVLLMKCLVRHFCCMIDGPLLHIMTCVYANTALLLYWAFGSRILLVVWSMCADTKDSVRNAMECAVLLSDCAFSIELWIVFMFSDR